VVAVPVLDNSGASLALGPAKLLFEGRFTIAAGRTLDVGVDGRFLVVEEPQESPIVSRAIVIVQNWAEELKRRVPVK